MSATIELTNRLPSVLSEFGQFVDFLTEPFPRVGVGTGFRTYFGSQYATMGTYRYADRTYQPLGRRMGLPVPRAYSGDSAAPFTVTPSATYNPGSGAVAGNITQAATPARWYVVSWGDESTADVIYLGGNAALNENDSQNPRNTNPFGNYGNYFTTPVMATIGALDTVVTISALVWDFNTDYNVTHAYFWAADSANGPFRYVGSMSYDPSTGFSGKVIYDTLAGSTLVNRNVNVNDFLCPPTFTSICTWKNGRIVAAANANKTRFTTQAYGVYVKVTHGSKAIYLSNNVGTNLTTKYWPRFVENNGVRLQVAGQVEQPTIDYVDINTPYVAYLLTAWNGDTTTAMTGDEFELNGVNQLIACCGTGKQNNEQYRGGFLFDGFQFFGGEITTVYPAPNVSDGIFVFTADKYFILTGLPEIESTQNVLTFTGRFIPAGNHGCLSPAGVCLGFYQGRQSLFCLNESFLGVYETSGVVDVSSYELRNWIQQLTEIDKTGARLSYDYTRNEICITLPGYTDIDRNSDYVASPYTTAFQRMDLRELMLRYNLDTQQLIIDNGRRCRFVITATGVGLGAGGEGSGSKVLYQDVEADVCNIDEKNLVDKQAYTDALVGGVIDEITDNYVSVIVAADKYLNPYLRGIPLVVQNGAARGAFAYIVATHPDGHGIIIGDWVGLTPEVDDVVLAGTPILEYQTGAIVPATGTPINFKGVTVEMKNPNVGTYQTLGFEIFTGGPENELPDEYDPTATLTYTRAQARSGVRMGLPIVDKSMRILFGFNWIQPFMEDSVNSASGRIRINSFKLETTEDAEDAEGDDG